MVKPEVTVITPTYNERENVVKLIEELDRCFKEAGITYEVVVVDDNSPDGTAEAVEGLMSKYPVKLVRRPSKLGLTSAVFDGLKYAEGTYVVVMDADLQHPPEVVPKLYVKALEGYDLVIASRYVSGGSAKFPLHRLIVSLGATLIARVLIPKARKVKDPMSGFFLVKKDVISKITPTSPKSYKVLLEVLALGSYRNVYEVPYEFRERVVGKSKLGFKTMLNYVKQVLNLTPDYVRFALVGASGTVVNLGVLAVLRYVANLTHEIASALAIEASIINNFVWNDLWTFKGGRSGSVASRLIKFHFSSAVGVITQYVISLTTYYYIVRNSIIAQSIGILTGFIINYVLSKKFVWSPRRF
ncbi:MAG: hypothetical protein B7O98_06435 [Zestosphaera tikiterensis]|uniref:Dolichol monophosphate mannose synthase n=1 Tax=Zestosphaera tikiterensis TaxID=1973259 RepID=A0A2R7Y417_9CREN|nr:MAG: hypothetical protein B7O98_06435 [Zestosphaera tikiterensis]